MGGTAWKSLLRALGRGGPVATTLAVAADALALAACWHLGYLFRMGVERWQPARPWYDDYVLAAVVAANLLGLAWAGLYRMPWRFFGFAELSRIVGVVGVVGVVSGVAVVSAELSKVARSVLVLHPVFVILALCLMRMAVRVVWEHAQRQVAVSRPDSVRRALLLIAGESVEPVMSSIGPSMGWEILGAFDDDLGLQGRKVGSIPVLGTLADLPGSRLLLQVDYVIVAVPRYRFEAHARAMEQAYRTGKTVVPWNLTSA
jgi:FlaA1/EpsC-like NDP-sugar epimerase